MAHFTKHLGNILYVFFLICIFDLDFVFVFFKIQLNVKHMWNICYLILDSGGSKIHYTNLIMQNLNSRKSYLFLRNIIFSDDLSKYLPI